MHLPFAGVVQKTTAPHGSADSKHFCATVRIRGSVGAGTSSTRVAELGLNVVLKRNFSVRPVPEG
jgi:hypothetical protein